MLMLSKARPVPRAALAEISTPPATASWRPVAHSTLVETLLERAQAKGLHLASEQYAVLDGVLYPKPGVQEPLKGARLFGSLDFEPIQGLPFPPGCRPSAGLRNSHDKSFALSILSGARVLVCANGVLSGEHVITRKHTNGIDLADEIDRALNAFLESATAFNATFERLQARRLSPNEAHHLIVELARAGAYASSDILPVVAEFEQPRHAAFRERTGWSLYNAVTEAALKRQSPMRQAEGYKALNEVLLEETN